MAAPNYGKAGVTLRPGSAAATTVIYFHVGLTSPIREKVPATFKPPESEGRELTQKNAQLTYERTRSVGCTDDRCCDDCKPV